MDVSIEERLRRVAPRSFKLRFRRFVQDRYARHFYTAVWATGIETRWLGVATLKAPNDLWIYQELLTELRPDVIIETGTHQGGSALYLATICDALDHGRIVTIDVAARECRPEHPRIEYVTASSVDPGVVASLAMLDGTKLVILDSNHSRAHVLAELDAYAGLVTPGSYLIVEDTQLNGHPVASAHGPGPWEAVHEWLPGHAEFSIDRTREKLMHTKNPDGYLRKAQS